MPTRSDPLVLASLFSAATLGLASPCAAQMSPGTPSTEQTSGGTSAGAMSPAKPMSENDMAKMKDCNVMEAAEVVKHADCMDMMRAHPDMMKHSNAMKSGLVRRTTLEPAKQQNSNGGT